MRFKSTTVSLALLALAGGASAQDSASMFSFSGFGTLAATSTDSDNGAFRTTYQKEGAKKSATIGTDSILGGQVNAKFNGTFSGTVQLLAKQDALGEWGPKVEWAFLKAGLGQGFSVRGGRMGAPFFMTSDYRNVGYTNLSARTPPDVYFAVPVSTFDGADVLYQGSFGDINVNGQLYAGSSSTLIGKDQTVLLKDMGGFNLSAEVGAVTLRVGHVQTTLGTEGSGLTGFTQLLTGLRSLSGAAPALAPLNKLADDLTINGKRATFTGVGISMDLGDWVGSAEVTKRKTDSLYVSDISSWYTTLGYRVGKFTPYLSLSALKVDSITNYASPLPAGIIPPLDGAMAAVNREALTNNTQKTTAIGVRWDAGKSYAIKGELARISIPAGSSGVFRDVNPNGSGRFTTDTDINVMTVGVDFVF